MKVSELERLLKAKGCTFKEGKRHKIVILGTRKTTIPRHRSKEIKTGTLRGILKELALEDLR